MINEKALITFFICSGCFKPFTVCETDYKILTDGMKMTGVYCIPCVRIKEGRIMIDDEDEDDYALPAL